MSGPHPLLSAKCGNQGGAECGPDGKQRGEETDDEDGEQDCAD